MANQAENANVDTTVKNVNVETTTSTIDTSVMENANASATAKVDASRRNGTFLENLDEDTAWSIIDRNVAVNTAGQSYAVQVSRVTTKHGNGTAMVDANGNQYGIVNFYAQTNAQQLETEELMEQGNFIDAINNTLNFRIMPDEFGKFTRGANVIIDLNYVDSIRRGERVLAVTALRVPEVSAVSEGLFAERRKARLEAKRQAYLEQQAKLEAEKQALETNASESDADAHEA